MSIFWDGDKTPPAEAVSSSHAPAGLLSCISVCAWSGRELLLTMVHVRSSLWEAGQAVGLPREIWSVPGRAGDGTQGSGMGTR